MPEGFESESFTGATSESRRLMRSGYGAIASLRGAEAAKARLIEAERVKELEAAGEERTGVQSPRSAALNMQAGYARNDAVRAGADVWSDPDESEDES